MKANARSVCAVGVCGLFGAFVFGVGLKHYLANPKGDDYCGPMMFIGAVVVCISMMIEAFAFDE